MGGEGANWIGEAPFSKTKHVFQNIGDGTYNHSGVQAIRAALAADVTITYKILYNDAVAMTGGQRNDGALSADRIAREVLAMGVRRLEVVFDAKEEPQRTDFPDGIGWSERADLDRVQRELRDTDGVSVLLYIQTCAAEKRRRRKRGSFPDIDQRVFINSDVCEGCGDCGVQSNCVSIVPKETPLGRKRAIDQSSCNKDFSCLKGFCPSFVTVTGGVPKKAAAVDLQMPDLPAPDVPAITQTWNMVITGVGGTGVVTIGAVLAQAAQLDGKGAGMMEMAGLAQKGGAVHIHLRLANQPEDIAAVRVSTGEADAIIGGDLVVTAGAKTLGLMTTGRTGAVVNSFEAVTGDFTRNTDFSLPNDRLRLSLQARLGDKAQFVNATEVAKALMGDAIFSNMILLGAAWQRGLVPLCEQAIRDAVTLNGAAVEGNLRAFDIGRWAAVAPDDVAARTAPAQAAPTQQTPHNVRIQHLRAYGGGKLARRFEARVVALPNVDLQDAVSAGYHKLLTYKDEYEVARLHLNSHAQARAAFDGDIKLSFHLAPPLLSRTGPDGRPAKRVFGAWITGAFRVLAAMRGLRGTVLDPFGRTEERRMERALIAQYEADLDAVVPLWSDATHGAILELARLPLSIKGFGPVKARNEAQAAKRREALLAE
ncbi:MAG: indolepyruvate ferredoxin oxidoreductase family protein, partial [Paracoccaceae bacterium]